MAEVSPVLLAALKERLGEISPERIDQVWLFAPRPVGAAESSLAVISLFAPDPASARREVLTLHCTATTTRGRVQRVDHLVEQGSAPADRVEQLIRGVVHRLRDEREMPRAEVIGGSAERWAALIEQVGST